MKSLLNIKYIFVIAVTMCVMIACGGKDGDNLSTDLVTNPKSASETSNKQAAIKFDKETRTPILIGSKCVGCHLCRLVCSQKAINTARKVIKR